MFTDVLGTVLTIANTIGAVANTVDSFTDHEDKSPVEVVTEKQVVVPQPVQQIPPVTLNLTINVYKDGEGKTILDTNQNGLCLDLK